jgi:hypothetical protein
LQAELEKKNPEGPEWLELKVEKSSAWDKASVGLKETQLFVQVTCGNEIAGAFNLFSQLARKTAGEISRGNGEAFQRAVPELEKIRSGLLEAARKELGIDALQ